MFCVPTSACIFVLRAAWCLHICCARGRSLAYLLCVPPGEGHMCFACHQVMAYLFCMPPHACLFLLRAAGCPRICFFPAAGSLPICFVFRRVLPYLFCVPPGDDTFVLRATVCLHICFACCRVPAYWICVGAVACTFVLRLSLLCRCAGVLL